MQQNPNSTLWDGPTSWLCTTCTQAARGAVHRSEQKREGGTPDVEPFEEGRGGYIPADGAYAGPGPYSPSNHGGGAGPRRGDSTGSPLPLLVEQRTGHCKLNALAQLSPLLPGLRRRPLKLDVARVRGEYFRTAGWESPLVRARSPSARTGEAAEKQVAEEYLRRA